MSLVQVENEYGAYGGNDQVYLKFLRDLLNELLGPDIILFTTDGGSVHNVQVRAGAATYQTNYTGNW